MNIHNREPFISVVLWIFNGSVFTIKLQQEVKFTVHLGNNPLVLAPTRTSGSFTLPPGTGTTYHFRQPVMASTKDELSSAIERHLQREWLFRFEADCIIEETGGRFTFKPNEIHHVAIPF
jgi:hypothetical protein